MLKKIAVILCFVLIASTQIAPKSYADVTAQADVIVYFQVEYFVKTTIAYTTVQIPRPAIPGVNGEFMYLHVTKSDFDWTKNGGVKSLSDSISITIECNDKTHVSAPNYVALVSSTNPTYDVALTLNFWGDSGSGAGSDDTNTWFDVVAPGKTVGLLATVAKDWNAAEDKPGFFHGTFAITFSEAL